MNKTLALFTIFILLLSLNIAANKLVMAQPTVVRVDPPLIEYHTKATGQQFSIAVKIDNVTNLYGFDIKFRWNTTFLEYVTHTVYVARDNYTDGVLWCPFWTITNVVNATGGTYWAAYSSYYPAPTFNGSGTVFNMTFKIKYHPVQPEPTANITLELHSVELVDVYARTILHTKQNGRVTLYAVLGGNDIAITSITPLKTVVGQGYTTNIDVTVANQGDFPETFTLDLYADISIIGTREVNLEKGASTTITFTWNTSGFAKGNYTIWAYALPVSGEVDTDDNALVDGWVIVAMPGDITGTVPNIPDGKVDIKDVALVSQAFGCTYVNGQYMHPTPCPRCPHNPNTDINNDQKIDIKDIATVSKQFGKTDP